MTRTFEFLFRRVDASSLAIFRIGFGLLLFYRCLAYLFIDCIECKWLKPVMTFKYYGFEWVDPLPGRGLHVLIMLMTVASLGIILGRYYRACMIFFTVGFTYLFLLEQADYLNHFYMAILFCVLMCVVPADRYWSLDAKLKPGYGRSRIPFWPLFLLGAQLEIILIYAGVVKLNWDWLNGQPLREALSGMGDFPLLGQLFVQDWAVGVAAYGVIALHLIGAPLLLVRKTRLAVLCIYASFHILNHFVFTIDIFPWMTLFASLLLFDPDWPKQFLRWLGKFIPALSAPVSMTEEPPATRSPGHRRRAWVVSFVAVWLAIQILVPLRHWVYPGNVSWNEEGHRFSWRMKLRAKPGRGVFLVTDQTGQFWPVVPRDMLTPWQARKITCIPDMILQFAHFLGDTWESNGIPNVTVTADIKCALNGRPLAQLVEPEVDLNSQPRTLGHVEWVLPLTEPLPDPWFK